LGNNADSPHPRLIREKKTIKAMISLYCRHNHGQKALCNACKTIQDYAFERLDKCRFGGLKPACNKCPVHCYKPKEREEVRSIMRFSGPRMILAHPYLAVMHMLDTIKSDKNQIKKH